MSDHKGAALIYPMLPDAETIIADKGYDSDAFREALAGRGITPCIPPRAKRRLPATYCKTLYRQRHKVENMFARLKDWRRISMRYDRCAHILQRYLHRGNRYLLARSMSPDSSRALRRRACSATPIRLSSPDLPPSLPRIGLTKPRVLESTLRVSLPDRLSG